MWSVRVVFVGNVDAFAKWAAFAFGPANKLLPPPKNPKPRIEWHAYHPDTSPSAANSYNKAS